MKTIRSSALWALICPPWSSTISLAMASPRPRGVKAVKLLEKPFELLSRYRVSVVCESDLSPAVFYAEADADLAVRVTVIHGVAQEVVKDAL